MLLGSEIQRKTPIGATLLRNIERRCRFRLSCQQPERAHTALELSGDIAMLVRFWGTRGSIATPGGATLRYGGNTSCVEAMSDSGTTIIIDAGTGACALGKVLMEQGRAARGHILITHTHWDHIQGLPFFAPLFVADAEWHIYGPRGIGLTLQDVLAAQMDYSYFPIALNAFLLAAGESPGSPQMDSFGPNMSLALDLLKLKEKDVVLQYFEDCRKFWKLHEDRLNQWSKDVKAGRIPDFGANLLY